MTRTEDSENTPQLDRARIRSHRAIAGLMLEECVQSSCLEEFWRQIERGECVAVDRMTVMEIAKQLDCKPEDLVSPTCPAADLPEVVNVIDTEDWDYSESENSGLRVTITADPEGRTSLLTINCADATPEEMEKFWEMLTGRVTT